MGVYSLDQFHGFAVLGHGLKPSMITSLHAMLQKSTYATYEPTKSLDTLYFMDSVERVERVVS